MSETRTTTARRKALRMVKVRDAYRIPVADQPLFTGEIEDDVTESFAPAVWLVGAHGGAGVSTLAHMWRPFGDAGRTWPAADTNTACVVVARSTHAGLEAAAQTVLAAEKQENGGCTVLGVIVVADAPGKLPKQLGSRLPVIEALVPVWHLPYVPGIRLSERGSLASWNPGDEIVTGRKAKKLPVHDAVPAQFADVAEEIFTLAFDRYSPELVAVDTDVEDSPTDEQSDDTATA